MEEKRTSVFENGLIWFGAAVSIAEMLTGTYFAPLGFCRKVRYGTDQKKKRAGSDLWPHAV